MPSTHRTQSWRTALIVVPGLVILFAVGCVTGGGQPHMEAALGHLESAKTELQSALGDKGGHRVRAIALVDRAIAEVQAGMDYAARH